MNIYTIYGASSSGTTFYKITRDDVLDVFDRENVNIFLTECFETFGWEIFDIECLYGSKVIDDILYLCSTDGVEIEVNDDWVVPEEALDYYGPEDLERYIDDNPTDDIIKHNLSPYELRQAEVYLVTKQLKQKGYSYQEIYKSLHELANY